MIKVVSPHFYWNKYVVSLFSNQKYFLSYDFDKKVLWYRVYKVATRSINDRLSNQGRNKYYLYSSEVGYMAKMYKDFFKFAFVRNPEDRFISAWKDKVLRQNYFQFEPKLHEKMKKLDFFVEYVSELDIFNCDEHLRCQSALIDLENVDFIGRFENFEQDFAKVADLINLKNYKKSHLNSTKQKSISIPLSVKKKIHLIYENDFDNFYAGSKLETFNTN